MRNVTPRSILNGVAARMGMDITQTIPAHTVAVFLEYITSQTRAIWERYPFPEWVRIEQRTYRPAFAAETAYVVDDEIFYSGLYYRALSSTTGNLPTDTTFWAVASDLIQTISLDQVGETPIGEVLRAYRVDPRVCPGAIQYEFNLVEDGVLLPTGPAQPWIEFSLRPPTFASTDLDGMTYPYRIAEAVKLLAAADAQREDGQFEKGTVLESLGIGKLEEELDKIELEQGHQRRWAV